jgi:hypothetical protein
VHSLPEDIDNTLVGERARRIQEVESERQVEQRERANDRESGDQGHGSVQLLPSRIYKRAIGWRGGWMFGG